VLDGEEAERLLNTLVYSHVYRLVYTNAIVGGGDTGDRGESAREGGGDGQAPMPPAAPTQQTQQTQARREEREAREALMLREALMPAAAARDTILAGNCSWRGERVGMAHVAAAWKLAVEAGQAHVAGVWEGMLMSVLALHTLHTALHTSNHALLPRSAAAAQQQEIETVMKLGRQVGVSSARLLEARRACGLSPHATGRVGEEGDEEHKPVHEGPCLAQDEEEGEEKQGGGQGTGEEASDQGVGGQGSGVASEALKGKRHKSSSCNSTSEPLEPDGMLGVAWERWEQIAENASVSVGEAVACAMQVQKKVDNLDAANLDAANPTCIH